MSNKLVPVQFSLTHCINTLTSPLNPVILEQNEIEEKFSFLFRNICLFQGKDKPDFLKLISAFKEAEILVSLRECIHSIFSISKMSHYDQEVQEYDLLLAIFDSDSKYYKLRLAAICKRLRFTPEKLLMKLFFRYESEKLFPLLPVEIGRVLARPELQQKIFEVNFDPVKIRFLADHGASDDKSLAAFVLGDCQLVNREKGIVGSVVTSWLKQDYASVCTSLEGVEKLIDAGKIKKSRFNYLLVLFHILSLL